MSLNNVIPGSNIPYSFNAIIEIPMNAHPIKYEVDKKSDAIFVDRFINTSMRYPCNYGYIPQTLSTDGDPVDVLVITPFPLLSCAVIHCRPICILKMTDESGIDAKVLAVPVNKILPIYANWHTLKDIDTFYLKQIQHFFEHYKDLEKNKWVKINGWEDVESAQLEILASVETYTNHKNM